MIPQLTFTVVTMFSCPTTVVVNNTTTWEDKDDQALEAATIRCKEVFFKSPCLKTFKKMEEGVYRAICGK